MVGLWDMPETIEETRARTNGNLIPFAPGPDSRRPNAANAGASVIEWYNRLANQAGMDDAALESIASDESLPRTKRMAAKSLMRSLSDDWAKNGKPHAADDLDRVLDRTEGRAVQRVAVETREVKDPAALKIELLRLLADQPQLRASLGLDVSGLLGAGDAGAGGGAPKPGEDCG